MKRWDGGKPSGDLAPAAASRRMTEILTEIEIEAPGERVWEVLTNFAAYPEWNPLMTEVKGEAKAGTSLEIHARFWLGVEICFRTTLVAAETGRELRWRGHFLFPAFFAAEHSFALQSLGDRRVRLIQREVNSGSFRPLVLLFIASTNRRNFAVMNQALKSRAEQLSAANRL